MIKYVLKEFAQALPDEGVRVEVLAISDSPAFQSAIPCEPITGLSGDFTNEDLRAAVSAKLGLPVELPEKEVIPEPSPAE